jgi:hypothetical protein
VLLKLLEKISMVVSQTLIQMPSFLGLLCVCAKIVPSPLLRIVKNMFVSVIYMFSRPKIKNIAVSSSFVCGLTVDTGAVQW